MSKSKDILIFIIEDDQVFTTMVCDIIGDLQKSYSAKGVNIHFRSFYSGAEAAHQFDKLPDIVVLDYFIMNDEHDIVTGEKLLKDLKIASPATEVIVVSGQENPLVADELIKSGASYYISKNPKSLLELEPVIIKTIDKKLS